VYSMKKLFVIFCLLLTRVAFADTDSPQLLKSVNDSDINDVGYMNKGNCKVDRNVDADSDDWVLVPERGSTENFILGYKTDGGACSDIAGSNDVVCVAGKAKYNGTVHNNTCFQADRGWAGSWLPGNDSWKIYSGQSPLKYCKTGGTYKWTPEGRGKTAVFVDSKGKVLTTTNGKIVRSLQGLYPFTTYDILCVAWVCVGDDNEITYGNANGDCGDDYGPNQDNSKHMNTVQPYLNALGNCN